MITLIAAAGENNALGRDNMLVWHLPDDFKRFKALTTGHPIIMGRKTFESFPRLLPHRTHIIITRKTDYHPEGVVVVNTITDAISRARAIDPDSIFIIGGGEVYAMCMELATHIELTRVHGTFEADTFLPEVDVKKWELVNEEKHPKDGRHDHAFSYLTYVRRQS